MNDDHQENNEKEEASTNSVLDSYVFVDDGPINSICKSLTGFFEKEKERERN